MQPNPVPGLHHVTAIAGDPERNLAFYTEMSGLRFVKRTINHDDTSTYHFYYDDGRETPGTNTNTSQSYKDYRRNHPTRRR